MGAAVTSIASRVETRSDRVKKLNEELKNHQNDAVHELLATLDHLREISAEIEAYEGIAVGIREDCRQMADTVTTWQQRVNTLHGRQKP